MGLIYMRTSPSGKSYIGQTNKSEEDRWKEHCYEASNPKHCNYNSKLNKAIRKYGHNNFSIKILEICDNEHLNDREQYWINYYDTYTNGYNSTLGGGGTQKYSDDIILKLWNEGLNQRQISEKLSCDRTSLNKRICALISNEERAKRHDETAANKLSPEEYETILSLWYSGKGINEISNITNHDKKVISNFLKKNNISKEEIIERGKKLSKIYRKTRKIIQYSADGEILNIFHSMKEAVEKLHIDNQTINKIIQGRSIKYKNIILKDIEE